MHSAHLCHELHLPQVVGQDDVICHMLPLHALAIQLAQPLNKYGVVLPGGKNTHS